MLVEGGFVDGPSKLAWTNGALQADVELPGGVRPELPRATGQDGAAALRITAVARTTADFLCDRGPVSLPALRLHVTGLDGWCHVLGSEVPTWQPGGDAPATWSPPLSAQVSSDGLGLSVTASGGLLTEFHGVDLEEHDAFVVARPVTTERSLPEGMGVHLVGIEQVVTGRLRAPLGNRVLVDLHDQPIVVTSSSTTVAQQDFSG